jgi:hypothetical protein
MLAQDRVQEVMNSAMNDHKKHVESRKIGRLHKYYFRNFNVKYGKLLYMYDKTLLNSAALAIFQDFSELILNFLFPQERHTLFPIDLPHSFLL